MGLSLYEPDTRDNLREEKTVISTPKDNVLAKFPTTNYTIINKRNKKPIISIKHSADKIYHMPVGAAGKDFKDGSKIFMIPVGAAGSNEIPIYTYSPYIREMADPHDQVSRQRFRDVVLLDPTVAPGIDDRLSQFFADGYTFGIELKSSRNKDGHVLTDLELETVLKKYEDIYLKYVKLIEDWDKTKNIRGEHKQRSSLETKIAQGRSMIRIYPPLHELEIGTLPFNLKIIPAEEMGSVIIERRMGIIIALRVNSTDDEAYILLPTGVIYIVQRDNALTREEQFFGRSSIESLVQPSRSNRDALNYHIPKAMSSTYIPKVLMEIDAKGTPEEQRDIILKTLQNFAKEGNDYIGIKASEHGKLQVVSIQPNHEMMEKSLDRYDAILMSGIKTTPARLGRIKGLTRDIVTIMEIMHIRNVRTTDERAISEGFIAQLYQPLLAHLAQQKEAEIPVRITIIRNKPTDETTENNDENGGYYNPDPAFKNETRLSSEKGNDISRGEIQQKNAEGPMGATIPEKPKPEKDEIY